jgi:hypothetical protein
MAYDTARGVVVLFGGMTTTTLSDETWTWDGQSWTQQHPALSPAPRQATSMVYDAKNQVVVLFGGETYTTTGAASPDLNDTWVWDGVNWQQRHPASSPSPRVFHSIAYDGARAGVVLFGGRSGQGQVYQDTWTWDGQAWTQLSPATSPPSRWQAAMAFDESRGVTVLFGGASGTPTLNFMSDIWAWDGVSWTEQHSVSSPPPGRAGHVMAYDPGTQFVLVYGGQGVTSVRRSDSTSAVLLEDTWGWRFGLWSNVGA